VTTEREIKLDVPEDFEMPDVTKAGKGLELADGGTATYDTAWFDTADLRLARWGASLRYRDGEGWTLKLDPVAENGMLFRGELTFQGDARSVPEAATALVRAYVRGAALEPRARATTTRRRLMIGKTDRPVVELVDDAVEVTEAPGGASRFRQIEIEVLRDEGAGVARDVAKKLRAAGAPKASGGPKIDRALGGHPDPEFEIPPVGKGSTIDVLVRAAIAEPAHALISHGPGVRLGRDPEDVHKARVATRRLRSNLRTFGDWLEPDWAADLRTELRWLADDLGAVRDADVMFGRLRDAVEALDERDRAAGAALLDRLASVRTEAGERLLASTATERYDLLLDRLVAAARAPSLRGPADAPAQAAAPVVVTPWRKLRRAVRRAKRKPDPTALHRVRIRAKRARYAAEAVQPAFGGRAGTFAELAAELQDVLGEHHDAIVLEAWLREAAAKSRARPAFVAGELAAQQRRAADVQAAAWPDAWRSLSRKRNRFWT
jgi:CHAD domain-containing protein